MQNVLFLKCYRSKLLHLTTSLSFTFSCNYYLINMKIITLFLLISYSPSIFFWSEQRHNNHRMLLYHRSALLCLSTSYLPSCAGSLTESWSLTWPTSDKRNIHAEIFLDIKLHCKLQALHPESTIRHQTCSSFDWRIPSGVKSGYLPIETERNVENV